MNTITLNHKGENFSMLTLDQHEQRDLVEHFDTMSTAFVKIKHIAAQIICDGKADGRLLREIMTISKENEDLAGSLKSEYAPLA